MAGQRLAELVRRLRRVVPASDACSDADLLARFGRARDDAAFELLVWRHGAMVLAACRRVLGHTEDAEDAFQATFLVLARKSAGIARGATLPAWLHRVAVRVAGRLARSRRPAVPLTTEPAADPSPDPVERAESLTALDEEIDRLPERHRRAVVLCYLEGLTAAEAAGRLGCPTGTVESRLAAARRKLHDRLTRRGVALPAGVLAAAGTQATLAPEAVARVVRAGGAFVRDGAGAAAGIVGEPSVRLAKGVLTMWNLRAWATVVGGVAAVSISAGVGWANRDGTAPADEPTPQRVAAADPPKSPPPTAKVDKPADPPAQAEAWPFVKRITRTPGKPKLVGIYSQGPSAIIQAKQWVHGVDLSGRNRTLVVTGSSSGNAPSACSGPLTVYEQTNWNR